MASDKLIKRRIKSAKNIAQITKAMQMVAASKMKKAQNLALSGRPYAEKIAEMVKKFIKNIDKNLHPLLNINQQGRTLVILMTTNKGLCGGLNNNLYKKLHEWFSKDEINNAVFATLGKKGESLLTHNEYKLVADFSEKQPFYSQIPALTTLVANGYSSGEYRRVYVVFNNFINALTQEPVRNLILPISELNFLKSNQSVKTKVDDSNEDFIVEPSIDALLDTLLFSYLENQMRDAVYEAEASEHSARMLAMKYATDNASELIKLLTLEYNKARQEKITYEIADMVTARLAIN